MFTTVSEFCHHILQSGSLEAKLQAPLGPDGQPLVFDVVKAVDVDAPIRDDVLQMHDGSERLPKLQALKDAHARAFCLERFAGHELQAVELFAWALLAFPDAPQPLRRGFLAALVEEQQHLRLYRDRLQAHDDDVGTRPMSNYFWKLMPRVRQHAQPLHAFLAVMGLTLEQANLDFALMFKDGFLRAGDDESAAVMQQVHDDEIGHVRLAAVWLPKLTKEGTLKAAYDVSIPFPLSLARAKGRQLHVPSRKKAGLDDAFIDAVQHAVPYTDSKAKAPKARLNVRANFGGEEGKDPSPAVRAKTTTLRTAFSLLFASDLSVDHKAAAHDDTNVVDAKFGAPFAAPVFSFLPTTGQTAWWPAQPQDGGPGIDVLRRVHDKGFAVRSPQPSFAHAHLPFVIDKDGCRLDKILDATRGWPSWAQQQVHIKPRWSTSTRGHLVVAGGELPPKQQRQLFAQGQKGGVVVEPHLDVVDELSSLWWVGEDGGVEFIGSTLQHFSKRGAPIGHSGVIVDDALRSGHDVDGAFVDASRSLVERARDEGFTGPCGVDGFTYRDVVTGDIQLRAFSEFNARFTAGWVALGCVRRALASTSTAARAWRVAFTASETPVAFVVGEGGVVLR